MTHQLSILLELSEKQFIPQITLKFLYIFSTKNLFTHKRPVHTVDLELKAPKIFNFHIKAPHHIGNYFSNFHIVISAALCIFCNLTYSNILTIIIIRDQGRDFYASK